MKARFQLLRWIGAVFAYGCLAAFVCLIGMQLYRWFRDGEWTHIGISDGLLKVITRCCTKEGDTGLLASFAHWLDTPTSWLGWHRVLEAVPASIGLFLLSVAGNFAFIYGSDRIDEEKRGNNDHEQP